MPTLSSLPSTDSLRLIVIWNFDRNPIDDNGRPIEISEDGIVSVLTVTSNQISLSPQASVTSSDSTAWLNPVEATPEEHAISYYMYVCDHRERTAVLWDDSEHTYAGVLTPEVWEAIQDEPFTTYATYDVPSKAISFFMAAEEDEERVHILTERYRQCLIKALEERKVEKSLPPVLRSTLLKEDPFRV